MDQTEMNILKFDKNVYSLEAVKNASYDFLNDLCFNISISSPQEILVQIAKTKSCLKDNSIFDDFKNAVLDHQVRKDTEEKYHVIRDIICAQAFEPVDNLDNLLTKLNLK
jgi:His-Xaa-Ser system protein HxsD